MIIHDTKHCITSSLLFNDKLEENVQVFTHSVNFSHVIRVSSWTGHIETRIITKQTRWNLWIPWGSLRLITATVYITILYLHFNISTKGLHRFASVNY